MGGKKQGIIFEDGLGADYRESPLQLPSMMVLVEVVSVKK